MSFWNSIKHAFTGSNHNTSYDHLPWAERTALNVGSGIENIGKNVLGIIGLDDYAPTSFTDAKNKIKTDISQKGYSSGHVSFDTLWKGSSPYKLYDSFFNDKGDLNKYLQSSLETGGGISGGGQNNQMGDDLPGRLGAAQAQNSLGKAIAYQDEPALSDQNYSLNNFNF